MIGRAEPATLSCPGDGPAGDHSALQSILRDAEQQFAALYVDVVELLNAQYFRHDTFEAVPSQ